MPEEEEAAQAKFLQKQEEEEEETAQAKGDGGNSPAVSPSVESGINTIRGGGSPLPESSRAFFEPRFGADFSGVKVHTDSNAAYLAGNVNAKAFTVGKDVVFGSGQYSPETSDGKSLMAHELTHVLQQGSKTNLRNQYIARAIKSVTNADGKGWLKVKLPSNVWPLPQYLKVDHKSSSGGRDNFKVKEGRWDGTSGSVKQKRGGSSYLSSSMSHKGSANVKFDKSGGKLWYGGTGPVAAKTMNSNPVPNANHDLEIPYEPHGLGARYQSSANFSTTWFRIGHSGDRFLHPGRISAGCVTVTDINKWDSIYNYLINSRSGKKNVGKIKVS